MTFMYFFSRALVAALISSILLWTGRLLIGNLAYIFLAPVVILLTWWVIIYSRCPSFKEAIMNRFKNWNIDLMDLYVVFGISVILIFACAVRYSEVQSSIQYKKECKEYGIYIGRETKYFSHLGCVTK